MKTLPIDHNLDLASAMLDEMENYLLSTEVFWPLDRKPRRGMSPFPRLTLGTLLLTFDQLRAATGEMDSAQNASHNRLMMHLELLRTKYAVAMEIKAGREGASRLNLWRAFVTDLEDSPGRAGNYAYEVRHRVMLVRLAELAPASAELRDAVEKAQSVDRRLQSLFERSAFIWDEQLEPLYPPQDYWYLYGQSRRNG
jgi:hypothetical protein